MTERPFCPGGAHSTAHLDDRTAVTLANGGRIADNWQHEDKLTFMKQIGAVE